MSYSSNALLGHLRWPAVYGAHIVMLLVCVALCGCSGEEDPTLPVSGMVKVDGKPVAHGDIEFASKDSGNLRRGAMIVDGAYKTAPMQGLMPGEYAVRIFSAPAGADDPVPDVMPGEEVYVPQRDLIPPEYNMRSTQTVTVTAEGPNVFDWDIVTKKRN